MFINKIVKSLSNNGYTVLCFFSANDVNEPWKRSQKSLNNGHLLKKPKFFKVLRRFMFQ